MMAKGVVSAMQGTVSTPTTKKTSNVEKTAQTPMSVRKRFKGEEQQADTGKKSFQRSFQMHAENRNGSRCAKITSHGFFLMRL